MSDAESGAGEAAERGRGRVRRVLLGAGAVCVLLWLALAGLRARWEGDLQAELDALAADGLGVSDEDLHPPAPARNGAPQLLGTRGLFEKLPPDVSIMLGSRPRAIRAALDPEASEAWLGSESDRLPLDSPEVANAAAVIIERVDRVEASVDEALSRECVFPVDWSKGLEADYDHLETLKQLAWGFVVRGGWAALHGRPEDSWRDAERVFQLACAPAEPTLISMLVRHSIAELGADMLEDLLTLVGPPPRAQQGRIEALLRELDGPEGYARAMRGEVNLGLHSLPSDAGAFLRKAGAGGNRVGSALVTRLLYARWRRDYVRHMARFVRIGTLPSQEALLAAEAFEAEEAKELSPLASQFLPSVVRTYRRDLGAHARVRLCLAGLRLSSGEGLPERAPADVPVDPWDRDGGALRYRLDGPRKARLWSVGPDHRDDGGLFGDPWDEPTPGSDGTDLVFRIELPLGPD